jgi:CBS domain-containing protein
VNSNSDMRVRDAMSPDLLTVEPGKSLEEAAGRMAERKVGSAVVAEFTRPWPGILTERDVLHAIAAGKDAKLERVAAHETAKVVFAAPDWPLDRAAETMIEGGFRHLVVVEGRRPVGMLSMRDIVRCWVENGLAQAGELSGTASEA